MTKKDHDSSINSHYGRENLGLSLLEAHERAGKDPHALRIDDLAPIEEFHIGGREATLRLGRLAELDETMRVLDVGCGIGGPARAVANEYGCAVTGVDLTEEFCSAGNLLTERVGMSGQVVLQHGSGTNLSFTDQSFDVVWTQHVTMNVEDKRQFFAEIARVLVPGGKYALYEIFAGAQPVTHFPVPWAPDAGLSFLRAPENVQRLLESLGFRTAAWVDLRAFIVLTPVASSRILPQFVKVITKVGRPHDAGGWFNPRPSRRLQVRRSHHAVHAYPR